MGARHFLKRHQLCFVTEADLDRSGVGGVVTDRQMLKSLGEFGNVDVIYLERVKRRSTPLALAIFFLQILKSFSKPYCVCFSRGLIASFSLCLFNALQLRDRKIVHRALSVPFASKEVKFLKFGRLQSLFRSVIFLWIERFVYSNVDMTTVASQTYVDELLDEGIPHNKIFVTNFVAEDGFFKHPIKTGRNRPFSFCYVGGFHKYQDLHPLLEAFELVAKTNKDVDLIMVGDGPQKHTLEEDPTSRKLANRLKFIGRIPHESLPAFLSGVDCFISLTRKPGLSISLVEAAAAGKPTIAFAKEGSSTYNDYFQHKKEIFLVNSIRPRDIANAMRVLYEDDGLRNNIAHGARRLAQQHFSQQASLQQIAELLQQLTPRSIN